MVVWMTSSESRTRQQQSSELIPGVSQRWALKPMGHAPAYVMTKSSFPLKKKCTLGKAKLI